MIFEDLREYLEALEKKNLLARINAPVDWDQEIAAIAQEAVLADDPRAVLFENIVGHTATQGRRFLVNDTTNVLSKVLLALNLSEEMHPLEAIKLLRQRCKKPVKPITVSSGLCKEVIHTGNEVNLFEFPTPKWHFLDGGRYIQTWGGVVTKDPETGWVNVGMYRGMIHDKDSLGMLLIPTQHWGIHAKKYQAQGRRMPVAITIGADALSPFVYSTGFGVGVCEYDMIGAIREKPLTLVSCETVDLQVPAFSEIVLEGEIDLEPASFQPEGPFVEYFGYLTKVGPEPNVVLKVKCITHRKDPILHGRHAGIMGLAPKAKPYSLLEMVPLLDLLEGQGITGIHGIYAGDPFQNSHAILFVSVDKSYYGQARQIAAALWGSSASAQIGKFVVVVDSDVDITDKAAVWLALASRCRPAQDIVIYPGCFGGPLDPSVSPEVMALTGRLGRWDRVLIDATWPPEWLPRKEWLGLKHPPAGWAAAEMVEKVHQRWTEYGL